MLHFRCEPHGGAPGLEALEFEWDPVAGTVAGPGADTIMAMVRAGVVPAHPRPQSWYLSATPLKSWVDMAAIVGSEWQLPDQLRQHYPQTDPGMVATDEHGSRIEITYGPARSRTS